MKAEHRELLRRCLEGTADESEREEFVRLLEEDAEILGHYCEEVATCATLEWHFAIESSLGDAVRRRGELVTEIRRRQQRQARWIGIAAAAALLVFAALYASFQIIRRDPPALMAASATAEWSVVHADGSASRDSELRRGDRLELQRGFLEIRFPDQVRGVLEGPALLTVEGRGTVSLSAGMLFVEVPDPAGHGFTVRTPRLEVTDLGTRFGVAASGDNPLDEIHVAEGRVRASARGGSAVIELSTGEAVRLGYNGVFAPVPLDADRFVTRLPDDFPPFIHWSFDEAVDGVFASEGTMDGAESFPAEMRYLRPGVSASPSAAGRFGGALALHGEGDYAATGWPGIGGNEPRSISLWFKIPALDISIWEEQRRSVPRRTLVAWGNRSEDRPASSWELDFPLVGNGDLRPSTVFGRGTRAHAGERSLFSQSAVSDGTWQHWVSVFDGSTDERGIPRVIHYIDGIRYSTRPVSPPGSAVPAPDTAVTGADAQPLRFGLTALEPASDLPTSVGLIDEVRIFAGALTPEQVATLHRHTLLQTTTKENHD